MPGSDDLLDPSEIEALLNAAGSAPAPPPKAKEPPKPAANDALLDPNEIEKLLQQHAAAPKPPPKPARPPAPRAGSPDQLLSQAEANLAAALSPNLGRAPTAPPTAAMPFELPRFDGPASSAGSDLGLDALEEVQLDLCIELGRTELLIEDVLQLREGSVVPLDKLAGDPVDILVNGRLIARGEVLVLNDNFCVRVAEILTPDF